LSTQFWNDWKRSWLHFRSGSGGMAASGGRVWSVTAFSFACNVG
jgi:hypothetical protein